MSSILKYYRAHNLNFSASSSQPRDSDHDAYKAFNKEGNHFQCDLSNAYWQISFAHEVTMGSYIISGLSYGGNSMKSWEISYSFDGTNFIYLQTDSIDNLKDNKNRFALKAPIICKHFKISGKTTTANDDHVYFYCFDCFWHSLYRNTCNVRYSNKHLMIRQLMSLMICFISN